MQPAATIKSQALPKGLAVSQFPMTRKSTSWYPPKRTENAHLHENLPTDVHRHSIQTDQHTKIDGFYTWWNVVYLQEEMKRYHIDEHWTQEGNEFQKIHKLYEPISMR